MTRVELGLGRRSERGQIAVAAAMAMGVVFAAVAGTYIVWFGAYSLQAQQRVKQDYVEHAASHLQRWYASHPRKMDAAASPTVPGCSPTLLGPCLLQAAGVEPRYGVQVTVGPRSMAPDGYAWRHLTVWIPKPGVSGSARRHFSASRAFASAGVNGHAIERANYVQAEQAVASVAKAMQNGYAAWLASGKNTARDWFQPPGCGPNGSNTAVHCAATWTPVGQTGVTQAVGWRGPTTDPWGDKIAVCNAAACGAQDQGQPYNLAVRTVTPWDTTIARLAVEPLGAE